jgi:hypothetical protein
MEGVKLRSAARTNELHDREQDEDMTARKTQTATTSAPRQTQRGVAKAATARKRVNSNAAKVAQLNAAEQAASERIAKAGTITELTSALVAAADVADAAQERIEKTTARKQAAAKSVAQKLSVLDPNEADAWSEVHAAGCAHLNRRGRWGIKRGTNAYELDATSLLDAAESIASDFIAEGSLTAEEALQHIHFAPCVKLPQTDEPAAKTTARKTTAAKSTSAAPAKVIRPAAKSTKQLSEIEKLAAQLSETEKQIAKLGLTERALAHDPLGKTRNELIVKLIKLDAGYTFIAKTRGVASSTNRGLCRVLTGGKRI